jgi:excinuclease ABC subunit C
VGKISQDAYRLLVQGALDFLKGDRQRIIATLKEEMERLSEELRFEDAAILRDRLRALMENKEGSPIVRVGRESSDTWGVAVAEDRFSAVVLRVVDGKVVHLDPFPGLRRHGFELPLDQLLLQYYATAESLPGVILLDPRYRESVMAPSLERILSERRGKKVEIRFPERGEERELLKMAERNARELLETRVRGDDLHAATALMRLLHLPKVPEVIECYDVSHHQGADPVGVQITFIRGFEEISRRRYYKLTQTADSLDPLGDPQWMAEMLERRLRRGIEEGDLPDLIILDGGKAQLSLVQRVYQKLEIEWSGVPVVALAKARPGEESASPIAREERLYLPGRKNPVLLKRTHPSYSLVLHLRDTTHRAVLSFHRHTYRSSLILGIERIPGIGPRRRQRLHQAFPDLRMILQTPDAEVTRTTGIPLPVVRRIREWLKESAERFFLVGTQEGEGKEQAR